MYQVIVTEPCGTETIVCTTPHRAEAIEVASRPGALGYRIRIIEA